MSNLTPQDWISIGGIFATLISAAFRLFENRRACTN